MQTIYQQYLDEAKKKAQKLASNAVSNVTLPQGNPAGQGAAQGATPANSSSLQSALQKGVSAAQQMAAAALPASTGAVNGAVNGAVANNAALTSSASSAQTGLKAALQKGVSAAKTFADAALPQTTPEQAALQQALEKARSLHAAAAAYAPTSTQGGRTADGKYRLGDGSTYDTLGEAASANAGANQYTVTTGENGETLYDGKPLHKGTGVLAAKGNAGKITSGPMTGTRAYDAEGNMIQPSYIGKDVETRGHTHHGLISTADGYIYDLDKATDDELVSMGYIRRPDGSVGIAEDQELAGYFLRKGDPDRAASYIVRDAQNQLRSGTLNVPGTGPVDVSPYYPQSGGKQSGSGGSKPSGQSWQDVEIPQKPGYDYTYKDPNGVTHYVKEPRAYPGTPRSTPSGSQPQTQPQTQPQKTPEQAYLDQYDYGQAPEWTGTDYETRRDAALAAAQGMRWDGSEYDTQRDAALNRAQSMRWDGSEYQDQRDALLAGAMDPYEGSPYDEKRNAAIEAAAEKWQGSEYQPKRDEALRRAENMQWSYDPNADPVWQALQKQYRREGDRATREALGQAAAMTGGVPSSYAVTAASQAGDYYAAQLSDRLPQVYQDAYNRYLQEFQRQMGISDQYAGFDDREYARWADQQGRNLDLADRYNQYGQQDYGMYQDRVNRQMAGADRYSDYDRTAYQQFLDQYGRELDAADRNNQYGQQAYQQYLDQYGQQLDAADRLNNYGATEYGRYQDRLGQFNTDRNFRYNLNRDAVEDARYEDERDYSRAWNEDQRNYERWMDQLDLDYRERQFAQQLKEYADAQNWKSTEWKQYLREYEDQLSEKERQWVYQMARDAESDRRYNQEFRYQQQQDTIDNQYRADQLNYQMKRDAVGDAQYRDEMEYRKQQDELDNQYRQQQLQYQQEQDELDRQYQQDVFDYNAGQDALDNEYRNNQYQQMLEEYDTERYYDMMDAFRSTGFADSRIAQYLGIPEGTSWEDYGRQYGYEAPQSGGYSGGYTGGGYTGGGPQTEPQTEPEPQAKDSDLYEFSNERHPNGNKMTKAYKSKLAELKNKQAGGASYEELSTLIRQLLDSHTITNYEGRLIESALGFNAGGGRTSHGVHNFTTEPFGE